MTFILFCVIWYHIKESNAPPTKLEIKSARLTFDSIHLIEMTLKVHLIRYCTLNIKKWSRCCSCSCQGNAYFKEGKYEAAVTCYSEGMEADSMNILLPANRAMAYLKLQRWARAPCPHRDLIWNNKHLLNEEPPCATGTRRPRRTAAEPFPWTTLIPRLSPAGAQHEWL